GAAVRLLEARARRELGGALADADLPRDLDDALEDAEPELAAGPLAELAREAKRERLEPGIVDAEGGRRDAAAPPLVERRRVAGLGRHLARRDVELELLDMHPAEEGPRE